MATIKYKDVDGNLISVGAGLHTHSPESIGASASGHTHDGRYYTENEVDTKLDNLVGGQPVGEQISEHAAVTASTTASGHMSATDKAKLDGIATGANKYTHPTTAGNKHIPSGGSSGQILRWSSSGTAVWDNAPSSYTLPAASATTLGGVKVGSGLSISSDVLSVSSPLPTVTTSNNGQFLRVVNGSWTAVTIKTAESEAL